MPDMTDMTETKRTTEAELAFVANSGLKLHSMDTWDNLVEAVAAFCDRGDSSDNGHAFVRLNQITQRFTRACYRFEGSVPKLMNELMQKHQIILIEHLVLPKKPRYILCHRYSLILLEAARGDAIELYGPEYSLAELKECFDRLVQLTLGIQVAKENAMTNDMRKARKRLERQGG